jgi:hypothetical protein
MIPARTVAAHRQDPQSADGDRAAFAAAACLHRFYAEAMSVGS